MKNFKKVVAGVALAAVAAVASAAVTFDPATGNGFVGKGDVQVAFGWNNKQAQDHVNTVTFTFTNEAVYKVKCVWTTGEGTRGEQDHAVAVKTTIGVNSQVQADARKTGQWTGYALSGFKSTGTSDVKVPEVGDACLGVGANATIDSILDVSGTGEGLYVSTTATPGASLGQVQLTWSAAP